MSFKFPSLVKLPSHRVFEYKPRYYDEAKEEKLAMEKRRQQLLNKSDDEKAGIAKENIQALYSKHRLKYKKQSSYNSNMTLIVIILGLLFITYFILFY